MRICADRVARCSVGGRGGKGRAILQLFPDLVADSQPLWDARDPGTGVRYEFKKQANLQWFDIGKYHDLTTMERAVEMVFLLHIDGKNDLHRPAGALSRGAAGYSSLCSGRVDR